MFNTELPLYGICNILSICLSLLFQFHILYKKDYKSDDLIIFTLYELIGIIIGGKLFTYLTQYNIGKDPINIIGLGMSSVGCLIGSIIMIKLFSIQFKTKFYDLIYAFIITIPLLYGIGKIGCFLGGCCRGILYHGFGAVIYKYGYNATGLSYFPVQLVEAIVFIMTFIYLFFRTKKRGFIVSSISLSFIICGISKFTLDFLRLEHTNKILSINQLFCLIFIIIGYYIWKKNSFKYKNT